MRKTLTFTFKTGEVMEARFTSAGCFPGMVDVSLYEVRPNPKWWQFKKVEVEHASYFPEDFNYNFRQMGLNIIAKYLDRRNHENNLKEMWK